jgi:predicted transcriptional regulator
MSTTAAVSVKLTAIEKERLAAVARKTKRSAHFLMREAFLEYLERKEHRLAFLEEAELALKDYNETGLYISAEAMEQWAKSGGGELPKFEKAWEK